MYILKMFTFQHIFFLNFSEQHTNPSPRTGPQDLLVTHFDCEENEQKTLHKNAINQVTQCESEPQAIETTNRVASNGIKNRLDHESFYQNNIERLLHLSPQDCKNELRRLNLTQNDGLNRKLVNFQVFPGLAHQAETEKHQGHIRLDRNFPFHGTHGRLTYDLHDEHWITHIGINDPSNCKADTKNKGYQEIMFFDWKIQLEKVQLTRDLKDDTILYRGIRLPCKNDQGYCDPTRTQATIVWFPEETCTVFQVAKIHVRMIKFHQKYFIESILFDKVNPDQIRSDDPKFRNLQNIENKLTRFQIYPETELAFQYKKPIYKTHYSEIIVEYKHCF